MSSVNQSVVVPIEKYKALLEAYNASMPKKDEVDGALATGAEQADIPVPSEVDEEEKESTRKSALEPTEVGALLPVKMKVAGTKLARYLQEHSILKWDSGGRITSADDMANASISDVVKDALSRGKKANPQYDHFYFELAKNSIIPYSLLRNPRRLEEMSRIRGDACGASSNAMPSGTQRCSTKVKRISTVPKKTNNNMKKPATVQRQKQRSHLGWYAW